MQNISTQFKIHTRIKIDNFSLPQQPSAQTVDVASKIAEITHGPIISGLLLSNLPCSLVFLEKIASLTQHPALQNELPVIGFFLCCDQANNIFCIFRVMLASRHVKKLNLDINDEFVPHFRIKLSVADPGEVWAPLIFRPN